MATEPSTVVQIIEIINETVVSPSKHKSAKIIK